MGREFIVIPHILCSYPHLWSRKTDMILKESWERALPEIIVVIVERNTGNLSPNIPDENNQNSTTRTLRFVFCAHKPVIFLTYLGQYDYLYVACTISTSTLSVANNGIRVNPLVEGILWQWMKMSFSVENFKKKFEPKVWVWIWIRWIFSWRPVEFFQQAFYNVVNETLAFYNCTCV